MKKHNFSAGPSILPKEVINESSKSVSELDSIGLSLIEISHRSKEFMSIMNEAQSLVLKLLKLDSSNYKVLFLQGGASMQFLMTAINLLDKRAGFINTGSWSQKAINEAKIFGEVIEVASSKDKNYNYIPKKISITKKIDYLHLTTNNTIFGTQFKNIPNINVPLIADMSSDIFSRDIDYSQFDLFYAGAQKNMGPAGTTLVVIKEDLLGKVNRKIPSMLDYKVHIDKESMFNTPPVFAVYTSLLTLRWIDSKGGLKEIEKMNNKKSEMIYNEIDRNEAFKGFTVNEDRSIMNATFNLKDGLNDELFNKLCEDNGISGIKGHRSVGGFRASIYNAMSIESIEVLINVMKKFEKLIL
jgi:phosphoserine aminotransferase